MTSATLLLRQVTPSWMQKGQVSSQAFRPTPKDGKKLSVYDGDQITAEKAWEHFSRMLGFSSVGVLAVSVAECASAELPACADAAPFPEHVLVNFTAFSDNEIRRKGKQLKEFAEARGWLYQAAED